MASLSIRAPALAGLTTSRKPPAIRRGMASIQANTLWSLHPGAAWGGRDGRWRWRLGCSILGAPRHLKRPMTSRAPGLTYTADAKWCSKPENADFCKRLGPVRWAPGLHLMQWDGRILSSLAAVTYNAFHHLLPFQVDLTGTIGTKRVCSVASHDYETQEVQVPSKCCSAPLMLAGNDTVPCLPTSRPAALVPKARHVQRTC